MTINEHLPEEYKQMWTELKSFFGRDLTWRKIIWQGIKYYYKQMKRKQSK